MNTADSGMDSIRCALASMGKQAKNAARQLACASTDEKNKWLCAMADAMIAGEKEILSANSEDMKAAVAAGLSPAMQDRLLLTPERIKATAEGVRKVASLEDPVGHVLSGITRPNGLKIEKVSVPIGVIGIIFESRPNVTADAASLCLKAGNAVILRGGKEAIRSNKAIASILAEAGEKAGMPKGTLQLIPWTDHAAVGIMLKMNDCIDLVMPRGGERLIRAVVEQSTIPVIKHYKGVCHIFADSSCDQVRALDIIENAKCQRPGVCNALETLLIHKDIAAQFIPSLVERMKKDSVELRGCPAFCAIAGDYAKPASEDDWSAEYLALILAVRVVSSVDEAIAHINQYGSGHSDSILTADTAHAEQFLNQVDSAACYVNSSTRFTDGGEFGMGAEIGISTDKLHARGPMGLRELTIYKYKIYGSGQIR